MPAIYYSPFSLPSQQRGAARSRQGGRKHQHGAAAGVGANIWRAKAWGAGADAGRRSLSFLVGTAAAAALAAAERRRRMASRMRTAASGWQATQRRIRHERQPGRLRAARQLSTPLSLRGENRRGRRACAARRRYYAIFCGRGGVARSAAAATIVGGGNRRALCAKSARRHGGAQRGRLRQTLAQRLFGATLIADVSHHMALPSPRTDGQQRDGCAGFLAAISSPRCQTSILLAACTLLPSGSAVGRRGDGAYLRAASVAMPPWHQPQTTGGR